MLYICFVKPVQSQQNLETVVTEQFMLLKKIAHEPGCNLEFSLTNDGSHSMMSGSKIVINLPQLRDLIKGVEEKHAVDIVRMILAHELAHQMQYRYYGRVFNLLLNECQADILAGFLLFQLKGQDFFTWIDEQKIQHQDDSRMQKKLGLFSQELSASLTVIFNLGDVYIDNDHPRSEERRRALREGIAYGNLWLFNSINNDPRILKENKTTSLQYEKKYKELLGYLPEDNVIIWSLRQAKKIVHNPRKNCKNIVVYNDFKWNTSANNPYITYYQKLQNIGSNIITINFYNQVNTVSRKEPNNTLLWNLISNRSFSITLKPGETKIINDSLQWVASETQMPSYNPLGDNNSFYYCSTLNDRETEIKSLSHRLVHNTLKEEVNTLDVLFSERNNFSKHISSVGTALDKEDFNTVYYESNLRLTSANRTHIIYDRESNSYSLQTTWEGENYSNEAFDARDQLLEILRKNGLKVEPEKTYTKSSDWNILDESAKRIGEIILFISSTKSYSLRLRIDSD